MLAQPQLTRAYLKKVTFDAQGKYTEDGTPIHVQFNPSKLTVQRQPRTRKEGASQTPGPGSTLSLELHFDATALAPNEFGQVGEKGVQGRTEPLISLYEEYHKPSDPGHKKTGVLFVWGKFLFAGVITSIGESLEFFAADGTPLRSKLSISIQTPPLDKD